MGIMLAVNTNDELNELEKLRGRRFPSNCYLEDTICDQLIMYAILDSKSSKKYSLKDESEVE